MTDFEIRQKEAKEREVLENDYKYKITQLYFGNAVSKLNRIVGLVRQSQFSLGLFMKLEINFDLNWAPEQKGFKVPEEMDFKDGDKVIDLILKNMRAYVIDQEFVRKSQVHMKFSYHTEEDLELLLKAIGTNIGISFLTFVYLHEVQHILRRHTSSTFNEIMLKTARLVDSEKYTKYSQIHKFANFAQDYCINNALAELFDRAGGTFKKEIAIISRHGLFDEKYKNDNEVIVLQKILKCQPEITVVDEDEYTITLDIQEKNEDGSNRGPVKRVVINKSGSEDGDGSGIPIEAQNEIDRAIGGIADAIQNHMDKQSKTKGEGTFLLNEDLGPSIKTNVDWFDTLKTSLHTIVSSKTRNSMASWSKPNSKFRHSHMSPTHKNIEDQLNIILSVDHSGSMSNESLKKLLYIIEQRRNKIGSITILKHTDGINGVLKNERDEKKILSFLSTRDNGGTSHREIFEYLDNNVKKHEIDKSVYISFSDNYSDIELEYLNYKNIQKITKVWLNSDGKAVGDLVPGQKVDIF